MKNSKGEIRSLMGICRQALERQKHLQLIFCSSLLLFPGNMVQAQTEVEVFKSPCDEIYNSVTKANQTNVPHRIPAIVEAAHGEILVFADKRWGYGDIGQHKVGVACNGATSSQIDIVFRRSTDLGVTWDLTKREFVSRATSGSDASGDVAVVANRENREEILVITAGGDVFFTESENKAGGRLQIRRYYSNDGGATWGNGYTDLTEDIYTKLDYDGMFFSSGRILQSTYKASGKRYCRLYAVLATIKWEGNWYNQKSVASSVLLCSDDFGATWQLCGDEIAVSGGDEAKAEELPNGNIVVSAKYKNGTRKFNIYDPKENKWLSDGGVEYTFNQSTATNGEMLIVPVNNDGTLEYYVLQSIPTTDNARSDVKIYYKKLSEADYTNVTRFATSGWCSTADAYMLAEGTAAYSTMIIQSDGKIGAAYEKNAYACGGVPQSIAHWGQCNHATGYDIMYKRISIADIIKSEGAEIISDVNLLNKKMHVCTDEAHTQASSAYSWATLYLPFTVHVPEGVTAYKVTGISEDKSLIDIEAIGNVVPAGEPVVLRDEMKRTEIKLEVYAYAEASADNLLQGCCSENIEITDDNYASYYVLSHGSRCEAFYFPPNGYLKAHLAYLRIEQPQAASLMLRVVDGETTEINGVGMDVLREEVPVYDLGGRRVQDATQPGVYIRGGKKYIVR
ncbi:MAG: exo-alpha-sialidase [Bacteroidaceae bacterium]|nr:exo-alpha-sialidase [Bacteroidaceae bacterium]